MKARERERERGRGRERGRARESLGITKIIVRREKGGSVFVI